MLGTIDLSDDGSGENEPLHAQHDAPDPVAMRKKLRKYGRRARTPPSMRDFIVPDHDQVYNVNIRIKTCITTSSRAYTVYSITSVRHHVHYAHAGVQEEGQSWHKAVRRLPPSQGHMGLVVRLPTEGVD